MNVGYPVFQSFYPILPTEIGVTNPEFPYGDVRRFGAVPGDTTDQWRRLQNAIDSQRGAGGSAAQRGEVIFPLGAFVVANSLTLGPSTVSGVSKPLTIRGVGQGTQIINRATVGKPTFVFSGVSNWAIRDLLLTGNSTHPNDGIRVSPDKAGNPCLRWLIERVIANMAGHGFVLETTNSGVMRDCRAWPSPNVAGPTVAQTVRDRDVLHHLVMTGDYVHDVSLHDCDFCTQAEFAPGHCGIFGDTTSVSQTFRMFGGVVQGNSLDAPPIGIRLRNFTAFSLVGLYAERSNFVFDTCDHGTIIGLSRAEAGRTIFQNNSIRNTIIGCRDWSVSFDATSINNTLINSDFAAPAPPQLDDRGSTPNRRIGVSVRGVGTSDVLGTLAGDVSFHDGLGKARVGLGKAIGKGDHFDVPLAASGRSVGLVTIGNMQVANPDVWTQRVYAVMNSATGKVTFTLVTSADGPAGGAAFTVAATGGTLRVTNVSPQTCDVAVAYYGAGG